MTFTLSDLLMAIALTITACSLANIPLLRALRRNADARADINYKLGQLSVLKKMGDQQLEDLLKAATKTTKVPDND